ncbi:MAG: hypothetical protein HKN21_16590, partial [Candidatus Eisenbacteria bacterium]|nr:hypothetical protein [Candidatus Eisenbacteria bacterium]
ASGVLRQSDVPSSFKLKDAMFNGEQQLYKGGSLIVDPKGQVIAGPLLDEEGIISAEIDSQLVLEERQNFDPAGHYFRPDVFSYGINHERQEPKA